MCSLVGAPWVLLRTQSERLLACLLPCAQEFNESRVRAATSAVAWCGGTVNWVWPVAKGGQEILSLEHINFCFFLIELVTLVPGPTSVPPPNEAAPSPWLPLYSFSRGGWHRFHNASCLRRPSFLCSLALARYLRAGRARTPLRWGMRSAARAKTPRLMPPCGACSSPGVFGSTQERNQ